MFSTAFKLFSKEFPSTTLCGTTTVSEQMLVVLRKHVQKVPTALARNLVVEIIRIDEFLKRKMDNVLAVEKKHTTLKDLSVAMMDRSRLFVEIKNVVSFNVESSFVKIL